MTRRLLAVAVLVAVVNGAACSFPTSPSPVININNNLVNTVTLANPVESVKDGCPAIGSIQVNRPSSLAVGETGTLAVTPKDTSGKDRASACDLADGLTLSPNPSDVVTIEDPHAFVTKVTGKKKGEVTISVNVGSANAVVRLTVN